MPDLKRCTKAFWYVYSMYLLLTLLQVLHKENRATIWYELVPSVSGENVDLGAVELSWKRVEQHAGGPTTSVITIPSMKISTAPFSAKIGTSSLHTDDNGHF